MANLASAVAPEAFLTFGEFLRYLRRRERLTQLELSIAVGYSESQISRLEKNQRLPDLTALQALFLPALHLETEPELSARLFDLARSARQEDAPAPGMAPYKGLLFFDQSDAEWFFGRQALTERLCARVSSLVQDTGAVGTQSRLLAIIGASGSGKSSLVRAGLAVALERAGWDTRVFTPTADPLKSLGQHVDRPAANGNSTRVAWLVDQFEEVFTLCREQAARAAFIEHLLAAANEPVSATSVVIALRADFYSHCAQFPRLREAIAGQQEYIGQMSAEELQHAIEDPARRGGWELEPGLIEILLRDIGAGGAPAERPDTGNQEPGALPLLSHALLATWERRRGRTLTLDGYRASGGVRGAIAETAESVFADRLNLQQREYARGIFLRLTELGEGTEDTRRRAALTELVPEAGAATDLRAVLNTLADARLVILGEDSAEVAHEALIREWQRLREWLNDDREGLRLHRHLTEAAREWEALKRDPGALYRGARLAQALEWAAANPNALNVQERAFLNASKEAAERDAAEREMQRQRELEAAQRLAEEQKRRAEAESQRAEEQKRSAKQLRRRAYFLASAFVLAVVLAGIALFFGEQASQSALTAQANARTAEEERRTAFSRELAASALGNLDTDPDLSLLLALQAVSVTSSIDKTVTAEAETALHRAVLAARAPLVLRGHTDGIYRAVFSPDGTRLATVSQDGSFKVWDASTGKELLTLSGDPPWTPKVVFDEQVPPSASKVVFSRDGTRLITVNLGAGDTALVKTWDVFSGKQLQVVTLAVPAEATTWNALSPDGTRMVFGSMDKTATVWDLTTAKLLMTLRGHADVVTDVEFSPDGMRIATSSVDRTAKIWDAATGNLLFTLSGHPDGLVSLAFSGDGTRVVTADISGTIKVWDTRTGRELVTFSGHKNFVTHVAFSPDGKRVATASIDRTAIVWDAEKGTILFTFLGHSDSVQGVAFSPDGKRLVTAGRDHTAKVWDLQHNRELLTLSTASIWGFSLSADGKRVAAAHPGGDVDVWNATTGSLLITLPGKGVTPQGLGVSDIAFSPDGLRLVRANDDATVQVWDVAAGKALLETKSHQDQLIRVAFSPDGRQIAAAGTNNTEVWDAATGKEIFSLPNSQNLQVDGVAYSPDGNLLATGGGDGTTEIWDAQTGKLKTMLKGHTIVVFGLAFSPDGKRLLTGSRDGTAKMWDLATGKELLTLTGHTSSVFAVAFSHDGTRIATASYDATTKLWDAATGKELLTLYGDTRGVDGVAFTPDDTRLITSSEDGTVRFYLLRIEDLVALARTRVTRGWTPAECQKYLHVEACPGTQ